MSAWGLSQSHSRFMILNLEDHPGDLLLVLKIFIECATHRIDLSVFSSFFIIVTVWPLVPTLPCFHT